MLLEYSIVIVLAYLLGSINSAILVGKFYGIDIRKFGSGNAGATNTLRTLGKVAAAMVLVGDMLKGILAVIIGGAVAGSIGALLGGLLSIIGHNWPVYFNFKGGKGILTSLAVVFTLDWRIGLISAIIGVGIIAITRYVSLGSIIGAAVLPILFYIIPTNMKNVTNLQLLYFTLVMSLLAIFRHRSNIKRLIQGNESKIGQKVKTK